MHKTAGFWIFKGNSKNAKRDYPNEEVHRRKRTKAERVTMKTRSSKIIYNDFQKQAFSFVRINYG
jgi:hypothetical protein